MASLFDRSPSSALDVAARTGPPRLLGVVGAYLFFGGAAATAAVLLFEPGLVSDSTGYWLLCAVEAAFGMAMLASIRFRMDWIAPLLIVGGILLITVAISLSGERTQAAVVLSVFYVWPALYAGYFFGRGAIALVLALIALAYCAASIAIDVGVEALVARTLITVTVVAGTAAAAHLVRRHVDDLVGRLDRLARVDPLTALVNRRGFDERFDYELERFHRVRQPLAVALGDIDRFKALNDRFGHAAGDDALKEIGRTLLVAARSVDTVARLGGEEFAVLMPATDPDAAVEAADRLRERVAAVSDPAGEPIEITFGVASTEQPGCVDADSVLLAADRALYEGKAHGGNRTVLYGSEMRQGTRSDEIGSIA